MYEEWVRVDDAMTRLQLAVLVAQVFNRFIEVSSFAMVSLTITHSLPSVSARLLYRDARRSSFGYAKTRSTGSGLLDWSALRAISS